MLTHVIILIFNLTDIAHLRKKFDEDKKKIAEMKSARKISTILNQRFVLPLIFTGLTSLYITTIYQQNIERELNFIKVQI